MVGKNISRLMESEREARKKKIYVRYKKGKSRKKCCIKKKLFQKEKVNRLWNISIFQNLFPLVSRNIFPKYTYILFCYDDLKFIFFMLTASFLFSIIYQYYLKLEFPSLCSIKMSVNRRKWVEDDC